MFNRNRKALILFMVLLGAKKELHSGNSGPGSTVSKADVSQIAG